MELIITVLTADRPGVIDAVSSVVVEHGGSWQDSRMAQMAGMFAGIIAVEVPDATAAALADHLRSLTDVVVQVAPATGAVVPTQRHALQVVANDRPGIVAEVSRALAAMGVNVAELATAVEPASMSGGVMFRARLELGLSASQSLAEVVAGLEGLSDDLMIDVVEA